MSSPAQEKGLCRPSHPAWQPEDHKGIPPSTYSTPMTCSLYHPLGLGFSGLAYRQTRWFGIGLARGAQQDGPLAAIGQSWGPKVKSRGLEFDPCSSFTSKVAKHTHTHTHPDAELDQRNNQEAKSPNNPAQNPPANKQLPGFVGVFSRTPYRIHQNSACRSELLILATVESQQDANEPPGHSQHSPRFLLAFEACLNNRNAPKWFPLGVRLGNMCSTHKSVFSIHKTSQRFPS